MSKIISTKKINACFLAIVLIVGTFAISSPLTVYGQQYEQGYESSSYPSEPPVMDDSQSVKPSQKANCDNNNVNINDIEQKQSQRQAIDNTLASGANDGITGQELTSEEALNALTGNGDPLLNIDRNILNVCFNHNDNTLTGLFSANQGQVGTPVPQTCEECFETFLTDAEIEQFGTSLAEVCLALSSEEISAEQFVSDLVAEVGVPLERANDLVECLIEAGIEFTTGVSG